MPNPVSFGEIAAWASLANRSLRPYEVDAIRELDGVMLRRYMKTPDPKKVKS